MVSQLTNFALQDVIYRLLQERPEWNRNIKEMVAWEKTHPRDREGRTPAGNEWMGWQRTDVHTDSYIVSRLNGMGIVDLRYSSRSFQYYSLASLVDTEAGLALTETPITPTAPVDVDHLFGLVAGHDRVKALLRFALQADRPVHCLLSGPPGTAKTLILSDIGNLQGAEFYVGSTTTKSGLVGLLLQSRPRYLVIDELDKMVGGDMSPLLNLMETGMVTRLMHGVQDRVEMETRVFAGANELRGISAPILNRFARFEIPAYTPKEFIEVAHQVLVQREDQGPEMAIHIASEVVKRSTDIRDAVRVARMAMGDPRRVFDVVQYLWPKGRG